MKTESQVNKEVNAILEALGEEPQSRDEIKAYYSELYNYERQSCSSISDNDE